MQIHIKHTAQSVCNDNIWDHDIFTLPEILTNIQRKKGVKLTKNKLPGTKKKTCCAKNR